MTAVKNTECLGHASVSKTDENVDPVRDLVLEYRRITVCEVADVLGNKSESVQSILKGGLNMCRITTKFISCLLNDEQNNHVNTCQVLQGRRDGDAELLERRSLHEITMIQAKLWGAQANF